MATKKKTTKPKITKEKVWQMFCDAVEDPDDYEAYDRFHDFMCTIKSSDVPPPEVYDVTIKVTRAQAKKLIENISESCMPEKWQKEAVKALKAVAESE